MISPAPMFRFPTSKQQPARSCAVRVFLYYSMRLCVLIRFLNESFPALSPQSLGPSGARLSLRFPAPRLPVSASGGGRLQIPGISHSRAKRSLRFPTFRLPVSAAGGGRLQSPNPAWGFLPFFASLRMNDCGNKNYMNDAEEVSFLWILARIRIPAVSSTHTAPAVTETHPSVTTNTIKLDSGIKPASTFAIFISAKLLPFAARAVLCFLILPHINSVLQYAFAPPRWYTIIPYPRAAKVTAIAGIICQ